MPPSFSLAPAPSLAVPLCQTVPDPVEVFSPWLFVYLFFNRLLLVFKRVRASAVPLRQSVPTYAPGVVIAACAQGGSLPFSHGRCKGGVLRLLTQVGSPAPGPPAAPQTLAAVAPRRCWDANPSDTHTVLESASHTAMTRMVVHLVVAA